MLRSIPRPSLPRLSLTLAAAIGVWAFLVNRIILHWVDAPTKTVTEGALALALGGLAFWAAARSRSPRYAWAAAAILALFGAGEIRRALLHRAYGKPFEAPTLAQVFDPVTTTELAIPRYSLDVAHLGRARLRVVHLSDLHVTEGLPWSYYEQLRASIQELEPEVIFLTGDYVEHNGRLGLLERWLKTLPRAPLGTFATLGNHDYWAGAPEQVREALQRSGVRVIAGSCETVSTGDNGAVRICGTDAPWGPAFDASSARTGEYPILALTHTPDNVYALRDAGVTAVFAGHTHGGQFRFPVLGALVIPSRFGRLFDRGHFAVDGTHLYVSAGVGADDPPLRLWCPPELVVVDLVPKGAGSHSEHPERIQAQGTPQGP
jgi:predicted MPP superfamily phosphohydrolase